MAKNKPSRFVGASEKEFIKEFKKEFKRQPTIEERWAFSCGCVHAYQQVLKMNQVRQRELDNHAARMLRTRYETR